jgi:hypothetical protein
MVSGDLAMRTVPESARAAQTRPAAFLRHIAPGSAGAISGRSSVPTFVTHKKQKPRLTEPGLCLKGCLTMSYFRTGSPHYHRR